ncbi:MAG: TolC family protein [Calditrichia bacterium]
MKKFFILIPLALLWMTTSSAFAKEIVTLTWNDVVGISRLDNLDLKAARQDYRYQRLNEWKALSDFVPSISYSFRAVNNIELPEFVFMGQRIRVGTEYNFTHVFELQYPIFTGGLRFANWRIQRNLKKSLSEELRNKEDDVVSSALESYFNIMLANELIDVNQRAYQAAKANLDQVEKFYKVGAASQLDYLRAKSRYSSTIPQLSSAKNARKLAEQNLKFILNLPPQDSLVVLDTLKKIDFLGNFQNADLANLRQTALQERPDLKGAQYQRNATKDQKLASASQFLPSVVFTSDIQQQAQLNTSQVAWDDYTRIKSAAISIQFPLFQGGKRALNYQQARIQDKKAGIQLDQFKRSILLDVENGYNQFQEADKNLASLLQTKQEAGEALRLANLTYEEGISTQVDVLGAQLSFTGSEVNYQQGIFNYNVSQLHLLKAIGKLNIIWNKN